MVCWIFGALHLCCAALVNHIFIAIFLWCTAYSEHCIFGAMGMHFWCYALSSLVAPRWCDYYCAMHLLVHCFLVKVQYIFVVASLVLCMVSYIAQPCYRSGASTSTSTEGQVRWGVAMPLYAMHFIVTSLVLHIIIQYYAIPGNTIQYHTADQVINASCLDYSVHVWVYKPAKKGGKTQCQDEFWGFLKVLTACRMLQIPFARCQESRHSFYA